MKKSELKELIKVSYEQVALRGRDAARIYHAVVELDRQVLELRKQLSSSGGEELAAVVD